MQTCSQHVNMFMHEVWSLFCMLALFSALLFWLLHCNWIWSQLLTQLLTRGQKSSACVQLLLHYGHFHFEQSIQFWSTICADNNNGESKFSPPVSKACLSNCVGICNHIFLLRASKCARLCRSLARLQMLWIHWQVTTPKCIGSVMFSRHLVSFSSACSETCFWWR